MPFPLIPLLIGLGAGAITGGVKHFAIDKPAADRKRKLAAETTRFSPWTGLKGEVPEEPNALGSIMQGASTGASLGANIQKAGDDAEIKDLLIENMKKNPGYNPWPKIMLDARNDAFTLT